MIYLKVIWKIDDVDMPILLYSETDDAGWEKRAVEYFSGGAVAYADEIEEVGDARLGEAPTPPIEEIAADLEFEPYSISQEEFEIVWRDAKLGRWPVKPCK